MSITSLKSARNAALLASAFAAATIAIPIAAPKFTSVWKAPVAREVSFAGKKVAAMVITNDDSLRVAGEEALTRELTGRGLQGVATYRIAPKEELAKAETARPWFEKHAVEGVVAVRPVSSEKRTNYTPATWTTPYYGSLWDYYGYGWGSVYIPPRVDRETVVTVETLIFSVPRNALLWAAVSETRDPKNLETFVQDLVKESVKELHKQGLAKAIAK
jgi:hypothetical protein